MPTPDMSRRTFMRAAAGLAAAAAIATAPGMLTATAAPLYTPVDGIAVFSDSMGQIWPGLLGEILHLPVDVSGVVGASTMQEIEGRFDAFDKAAHPNWLYMVIGGHVNANRQHRDAEVIVPTHQRMSAQVPLDRYVAISLNNDPTTGVGTEWYDQQIRMGSQYVPPSINQQLQTYYRQRYLPMQQIAVREGLQYIQDDLGLVPTDTDVNCCTVLRCPPDTLQVDACTAPNVPLGCGNPGHPNKQYGKPFWADKIADWMIAAGFATQRFDTPARATLLG